MEPVKVLSQTDLISNDKLYRLRSTIVNRLEFFEEKVTSASSDSDYNVALLSAISVKYKNYIFRLDSIRNIYHHPTYDSVYQEVKKWPNRKEHLKEIFNIDLNGCFEVNGRIEWFMNSLNESNIKASHFRIGERLKLEIRDRYNDGWFIVFSTLTCDTENYTKVFETGSKCWFNYIRSIKTAVARRCYGSRRKADGKEYFTYFAVVELGGKTGRLHIHSMMFMKKLPYGCIDPNVGVLKADRREIKGFCPYWKYGFSSHIAVRFSEHDPFGVLGWRWPVDNEGQPIENSTVGKVAGYLTKYVTKSKNINLNGEVTSWKVRMSRGMGQKKLMTVLSMMSLEQLLGLSAMKKYPRTIKLYGEKVPNKIIRSLAVKLFLSKIQRPEKWLRSKDTRLKMLLKNMTLATHDRKAQSFGDSIAEIFSDLGGFDGCEELWHSAVSELESHFPVPRSVTAVSGGNVKNSRIII